MPNVRGETISPDRVRFRMPGWENSRFYTRPHEDTGEVIVGLQWYQPNTDFATTGDNPGPSGDMDRLLEAPLGDCTIEDVCWHLVRITLLHEAGEYFVTGTGDEVTTPWNPHHWLWWKNEEQDAGPASLQKGAPRT